MSDETPASEELLLSAPSDDLPPEPKKRRPRALAVLAVAVVLAMAGTLAYLALSRPGPVAMIRFQVMPPVESPLDLAPQTAVDRQEMLSFMRRQSVFILQGDVLEGVFRVQKVRDTQWFKQNFDHLAAQARRDISVSLEPDMDLMRVTMHCDDPTEAVLILNTLADEYVRSLSNQEAARTSAGRRVLAEAVDKIHSQVDQNTFEMRDFRVNNHVVAAVDFSKSMLDSMEETRREFSDAEASLVAARTNYQSIQQQVQNGTLELTGDMQMYVENDPQLRAAGAMELQLKVDRDVMVKTKSDQNAAVKELDARLEAIHRQKSEIRERLESEARAKAQQEATSRVQMAEARFNSVAKVRDTRELELRDLDRKLITYKQMEQDLAVLQTELTRLQHKMRLHELSQGMDTSRVRQMGKAEIVTDEAEEQLPAVKATEKQEGNP